MCIRDSRVAFQGQAALSEGKLAAQPTECVKAAATCVLSSSLLGYQHSESLGEPAKLGVMGGLRSTG